MISLDRANEIVTYNAIVVGTLLDGEPLTITKTSENGHTHLEELKYIPPVSFFNEQGKFIEGTIDDLFSVMFELLNKIMLYNLSKADPYTSFAFTKNKQHAQRITFGQMKPEEEGIKLAFTLEGVVMPTVSVEPTTRVMAAHIQRNPNIVIH